MLFSGALLAQGQETSCITQTWLDVQSSGKQSSHFIGVGEAADLDQAYRLADLDLWHGIYRADGHEPRYTPAEFVKQAGGMPSQDELDDVVDQFYRRALGEAHRERQYQYVCGRYVVMSTIPRIDVGTGYRQRNLVGAMLQFLLEGRRSEVEAELAWLIRWSKKARFFTELQRSMKAGDDVVQTLKPEAFSGSLRLISEHALQKLRVIQGQLNTSRSPKVWADRMGEMESEARRLTILVKIANHYLDDENVEVLRQLRDNQSTNDAAMLFIYGEALEFGIGTQSDMGKARGLYHRSADAGFPLAIRKLGYLYSRGFLGEDRSAGLPYLKQSAEAGDSASQLYLAQALLDEGQATEAHVWLDKAVAKEFLPALAFKGQLLIESPNSSDDDKLQGIALLKKASKAGDPEARKYIKENKGALREFLKKKVPASPSK